MPALSSRLPPQNQYPQGYELRVINFTVDRSASDVSLGFNIRGGAEFNLGIFVSGVTKGSIADNAGFEVGDEIIDVNGTSFIGLTHKEAVDIITSIESLRITVRSTGRIPEEQQHIGKHSWISNDGKRVDGNFHQPDYDFATEDLYPESHHGSDNSLPIYADRNLHIPPPVRYSPIRSNMDQQRANLGSSKKGKDSQRSKKSSKKIDKKQKGKSVKGSEINDARSQLVNMVCDKLLVDFSLNECGMIRQSIALYHGGESVEDLLSHILQLFTPRKFELLREIRKVIYEDEVKKYDELISSYLRKKIDETQRKEREAQARENKGFEPEVIASSPSPTPAPPPDKVVNEIILQPVKSSYKRKDSSKGISHQVNIINVPQEPAGLSPESEPENVSEPISEPISEPEPVNGDLTPDFVVHPVIEPVVEPDPDPVVTYEAPTIKPFVPFVPEAYVLYDKDRNPVQKLVHGIRLPPPERDETDAPVQVKVASTPSPKPAVKPKPTVPAPETSPKPILEVQATPVVPVEKGSVKKVVTVETTEIRKKGRKESIEISKKPTKDSSSVVTVRKTSVESQGKTKLLTIDKSSFDENSNTITINATLNVDKPKKSTEPSITEVAEVASTSRKVKPNIDQPILLPVLTSEDDEKLIVQPNRTVLVNKNHKLIGLSISGGSDSRYQREIRVVSISPDSAASNAGLKVGQTLVGIDQHSLANKTHLEACTLIRSTFRDKSNNIMKLFVE